MFVKLVFHHTVYQHLIRKYFFKPVVICSFFLLSMAMAHAQSNLAFDHLTMEDGLLDNFTYSIFQDDLGYIWIGGKAGLQRYDGYSFLDYSFGYEATKAGVEAFTIRHIMQARDGSIWVGTSGGGLFQIQNGLIQKSLLIIIKSLQLTIVVMRQMICMLLNSQINLILTTVTFVVSVS